MKQNSLQMDDSLPGAVDCVPYTDLGVLSPDTIPVLTLYSNIETYCLCSNSQRVETLTITLPTLSIPKALSASDAFKHPYSLTYEWYIEPCLYLYVMCITQICILRLCTLHICCCAL